MSLLLEKRWTLLPNTAGCYTADEAVRTLRLARELGIGEIVKLELIGDAKRSYPDNEADAGSRKLLVKEASRCCELHRRSESSAEARDVGCAR